jgi:diaminopimelate decarboxylase
MRRGVSLEIARRFGTPCCVIRAPSSNQPRVLRMRWRRPALVAYSVKANSNLGVLALLARLGAGFDIVSGGELARVLAAGGDARKVLFSGVGKEGDRAGARAACSASTWNRNPARVDAIPRADAVAPASADVDPKTHPYISAG